MSDVAELSRCQARGTTPKAVIADLKRIRAACDGRLARAAELVGIGESTFGNALGGHAPIRESLLTALYGEAGATLLTPIAAVVLAHEGGTAEAPAATPEPPAVPAPPEPPPAAERPVDQPAEPLDAAGAESGSAVDAAAAVIQRADTVLESFRNAGRFTTVLFGPLPATPAEPRFTPDLLRLNVGHLLANAEAERNRLAARMAELDRQIEAVHALASTGA